MKRLLVVVVTGLLTGCPSGADRISLEEPAAVMARGDTICLLVANKPDEVIRSVEIYSEKGESLMESQLPERNATWRAGSVYPIWDLVIAPVTATPPITISRTVKAAHSAYSPRISPRLRISR